MGVSPQLEVGAQLSLILFLYAAARCLRNQFLGKHHWKFMRVGAQLMENAERAQRRQNALAKDPEYIRRKASAHFLHIRGEGAQKGLRSLMFSLKRAT